MAAQPDDRIAVMEEELKLVKGILSINMGKLILEDKVALVTTTILMIRSALHAINHALHVAGTSIFI